MSAGGLATLGDIIQYAMDRTDNQNLRSTGKYSIAYWTRMVNMAQSILAQATGYKMNRFPLSLTTGTQFTTMPSTLCWGITSVKLGTSNLTASDEIEMDRDYPGWRYQSNFPNQPNNDNVEILSSSALDITQVVTIYGTAYSTKAYTTDTVTLTGTTQVLPATTTAWDEIFYVIMSASAVGTVTVRESSANATITTITIGETTSGMLISTDTPSTYIISYPNFEWYPIPDANYTVWIRAGILPDDFTTPASLAAATSTPSGLPAQFWYLLAEGAAALAMTGDLYNQTQDVRRTEFHDTFWNGAGQLSAYLDGMQRDRESAIPINNDMYGQFYDNR